MNFQINRTIEEKKLKKILDNKKICLLTGQLGIGKTHFAYSIFRQEKHYLYISMNHESAALNNLDKNETLQHEDSICVIDDIDDVDKILEIPSIKCIRDKGNVRLLLISNSKNVEKSLPTIVLKPLTEEEMLKIISNYKDISDEDAQIIIKCSQGNPRLLFAFFNLQQNQGLSADEIMSTFAFIRARNPLYEYAINTRSKKQTPEKSRELLFQISLWGPIERNKLTQWNPTEDMDTLIEILITNNYITSLGNKYYATAKQMKFKEKEQRLYLDHLVHLFSHDATNCLKNENDIIILIEQLKKYDDTVAYVTRFYEEQYRSEERKMRDQQKAILAQLLESQLKTQLGIQSIEVSLNSLQNNISSEIDKMIQVAQNDTDTVEKLNQLLEISKNPKKNKLELANNILGALGSVASIASIMGVSNLPVLFNQLLNIMH